MPIIISALHFPWRDMADCFRVARHDYGLDGVELSLLDTFDRPHCTREDLAALPGVLAATEMTADAHIWNDLAQLGEAAGAAALLDWLAVCRRTGIRGLVLHGGSYPDPREGLARTRRVFEAVLGHFEAAGVAIKLENHYAYDYRGCQELFGTPEEFTEVVAAIDSPALRCCFDTGHGHMTRNWDALLRAMAPYLAHVHLADNYGEHDDHCPYRHGTVPWDAMLTLLRDLAFDGTYCVEFPATADPAALARCVGEVREYGAE
jgi:sugar phosphate isomerase/epimerase